MVKVKICGITNLEDAFAAITCGADAIGFLVGQVHPSRSVFISAEVARGIAAKLPPFCSTVLVTHLSRPAAIMQAARVARVTTIQLHGETEPDEAETIRRRLPNVKVYKAVHVLDERALAEARRFLGKVDGIVLDTAVKETGQVGGTGQPHDWRISRRIVQSVKLPVILAGGLNPGNVRQAIRLVRPYAVDVNSGVSTPDGTKDIRKLRLFIERAKIVGKHARAGS
ncbi:MAG TPA: phosphoribosylanthranilate isomerase [Candidatus Limnocylindrales bacterium]|jgi:phosphoribosylanthranilate isomerase|nr:phosphoribosylanthranilate isomerase [Candidatus Limnocylindrales bacterium]